MKTLEQGHWDRIRLSPFQCIDNPFLHDAYNISLQLLSRSHEILQGLKAADSKIHEGDHTKVCKDRHHDVLDIKAIIDQEQSVLHESFNHLLDLVLRLAWDKVLVK